MRRRVLLDPGRLRSRVAGAGKLTRGDRLEWIAAREQPAPPMRRRGGVSTLSRLTEAVGSVLAGRKILTAS
jgi:hypothetical protein